MQRDLKTVLTLLLSLALLTSLSACSAPRTPEGFCSVVDKHRQRYEAAMSDAQSVLQGGDATSLVAGLAKVISAVGDLQIMWNDLADAAPEDIRSDVEAVRDNNQKQLDALKNASSDPIGVLTSGVLSGLTASGSYQRVDQYAAEHCGSAFFGTGQ